MTPAPSRATSSSALAAVAEGVSDNYGDFKFDRLAEDSGAYAVEIEVDGLVKTRLDVSLSKSISLGEIRV